MDFFQDHHGTKYLIVADYFSKFPIHLPSGILHIISRPSTISEISSQLKVYPLLWCLTMALHLMETNSKGLHESSTSCTPHHHLTSTNPMVSLRPWWRRFMNAYKKTDGSPNALASALLQLWDTPISTDLPSPAEILHGWPAQGAVLFKTLKTDQHMTDLTEACWNSKHTEETVRAGHKEQRIYECSRWMNEYSSFLNKQGMGPLSWLTGTVTEILDCGHSYMIQSVRQSLKEKQSSLKPICYDGMSFQDHPVKKRERSLKSTPFTTPSQQRWKPCHSRRTPVTWTADPCLFYETNMHQRSPSSPSPQWLYSPRLP